jgi:hypothetical protein
VNAEHPRRRTALVEGNDKQDAILSRLDMLVTAVSRLADAMEGAGVNPNPTPQAAPAHRGSTASPPKAAHSALPSTSGAASPPSAEGPPSRGETIDVLVDEYVVTGVPGAAASFAALLARMFEAVLKDDTETAWLELTALTHPKELFAPRALDSLKAFSWKQLRKNAPAYLARETTDSFSIIRTDPAEPKGDELRVKVFLNARGRSPAPVTLLRDEAAGGAWRLGQVSL